MSSDFLESVILITSGIPNNRFGTAFIIHRDEYKTYLLTCAHVVTDVGGPEQVKVRGISATVIAYDPEIDLAVLLVESESLLSKLPLGLRVSSAKGNSVIVVGFQPFNKTFLSRPIRGHLGEQLGLTLKEPIDQTDARAWDLKIEPEYPLEPGYSGSPVIDETIGKVIGVATSRTEEGKKGVAISITALKKIWKEMPPELLGENVRQNFETATAPLFEVNVNPPEQAIEVFISYEPSSRKDNLLLKQLENQLSSFEGINVWNQSKIGGGKNKLIEIENHLNLANIILLLISPDYMKNYRQNIEVQAAIKKYESRQALVIPILLISVANWGQKPFGTIKLEKLQSFPKNGKFVDDSRYWRKQNEAFVRISEELAKEIEDLRGF